ncbi:MAG: hypothetical protein ACRC8C_01190 [Mycoplasmoidaceae bacterium]
MNKTVKIGLALLSSVAVTSVASTTISFIVDNNLDGKSEKVANMNSPFWDKDK